MYNHHIGVNATRPTESTQQQDLYKMADLPLAVTQEFYGQEQLDFWKKLDKKREKLNAEIASFKKVKEQEYQDYEKQLRRDFLDGVPLSPNEDDSDEERKSDVSERLLYSRRADAETAGYSESTKPARKNRRKHRHSNTPTALATPPDSQNLQQAGGSRPVDRSQPTQDGSTLSFNGSTNGQSNTGLAPRGATSTTHSESSSVGSSHTPKPTAVGGDHEKGFDGVITPNFLPLIDTSCGRSKSNQLLEATALYPKPSKSSAMATALHVSPSLCHQLSSSAEYHHKPGMTSPPAGPARPLSSSVPPEHEGPGHRRSSSTSGEEGGRRRSSLRRPNASEPKSPKKVLFSIDDKVVSPSTSPIAKRGKENARPSKRVLVPEEDKYQVIKNKPLKQPSANGAGLLAGSLSSVNSSANGWASDVSPLRWAMDGGEVKKPSPDDFVKVEDDTDMFSFDEEMRAQVKKEEAEESKVEGKFGREGDDDEEMEAEKPLTGSSPHAGSLPIEIKWPGRRESRG